MSTEQPVVSFKQRERRYRIFRVMASEIMELLCNWRMREYVSLPVLKDIPSDAIIESVRLTEPGMVDDGFYIKVFHESFPVLNEGCAIKVERGECETVLIGTGRDTKAAEKVVSPEVAKTLPRKPSNFLGT